MMIKKNLKEFNNLGTAEFYRANILAEKFGVAAATIWLWSKNGLFPKPVKLSPKCTVWVKSEIDEWLNARLANRNKTN